MIHYNTFYEKEITVAHKNNYNRIKTLLLLLLGSSILSFGMYNIHHQCQITEGGILGFILLIQHWFSISPSTSGFLLNILCYGLGWKILGNRFLKYSIFSTGAFSLSYRLWEIFPPIIPSLYDYPFIASIIGALFVGIGAGICVRSGGASGGDDALAMVISHITKKNIAYAYLGTDFIVLALSLSYLPLSRIAYSVITVTLSGWLIGRITQKNKLLLQDL